jgi:DNA-binding MarR family transcriptional regulator
LSKLNAYLEYARQISKIITNRMNLVGKKYNLSSMETKALLFFSVEDHPSTACEFSKTTLYSKSNVSKALDNLSKGKLITLESREDDRRYQEVKLTEAGFLIAKDIRKSINPIIQKLSNGITDEDRKVMYPILHTVRKNIDTVMMEIQKDSLK